MAAIYSNGGNCWNILGFNFTKRDALSSVYKISMVCRRTIVVSSSTKKFTKECMHASTAVNDNSAGTCEPDKRDLSHCIRGELAMAMVMPIDILYTLDSASNYSAIQKLKP